MNNLPKTVILIVFVVLILLPWIFFGVDTGDVGYHGSKAWVFANYPQYMFWEVIWLSTVTYGMLIKLFGVETILGLRYLWVGWIAANAYLSYKIAKYFYDDKIVFKAIIITSIVSTSAADQFGLNYYNIPPLFMLGGIVGFLFFFHKSKTYYHHIAFLILGISAALLTQARLPSLVWLLWMLLMIPIDVVLFSKPLLASMKRWFTVVIGYILGTILIFTVLAIYGYQYEALNGIVNSFTNITGDGGEQASFYSPSGNFMMTLQRYGRVFVMIIVILFVYQLLKKVIYKLSFNKVVHYGVLFTITFLSAYLSFTKYGVLLSLYIAIAMVGCAATLLRVYSEKKYNSIEHYYLFTTVFISLGGFLASDFGSGLPFVQYLKFPIWLILPFGLIEIMNYLQEITWGKTINYGLVISAFLLFTITRIEFPEWPYRNAPIYLMFEKFSSVSLHGIYGEKDKVQYVDGVVEKLKQSGLNRGDKLLVYGNYNGAHYPPSTLYLLTHTIPIFKESAIEYAAITQNNIRNTFDSLAKNKMLPKLIVRQNFFYPEFSADILKRYQQIEERVQSGANFPYERFGYWFDTSMSRAVLTKRDFTDSLLKYYEYKESWSNKMFSILER